MEIIIKRGSNRNTLTCKRKDGTATTLNLGPDLPNHDMAHYVVEKHFNLKNGFYGMIKSGMTIEELSDKEIIKNLGPETWLAEIMTRNLQAISSGSSTINEYIKLVEWEASTMKGIKLPQMNLGDIEKMKVDYDLLCKKWEMIPEHEELKLIF